MALVYAMKAFLESKENSSLSGSARYIFRTVSNSLVQWKILLNSIITFFKINQHFGIFVQVFIFFTSLQNSILNQKKTKIS